MKRLLIVGAGSIGTRHAQNARSLGVAEIAIVDPDAARCAELAGKVGGRGFAAIEDALSWRPDGAIVCPPPALHIPIARQCAAAGCHLLIEKPLAASRDGLDALAAEVSSRSLRAAVAYQLRFHPALQRMRALIGSGGIGRLLAIQAEYGQYLPAWRPARDYRDTYTAQSALGGGILLDGSHEIDYVRWLAGEVTAVFARAAHVSDLEMDVEDTAAMILSFAAETVGEIHLDCVQRGYSRRCVLIGSEATVRWDATSGLQITSAGGATHHEPLVPEPNQTYVDEMAAFLRGEPGHASIDDGARVLSIVLAAKASAQSRAEVRL